MSDWQHFKWIFSKFDKLKVEKLNLQFKFSKFNLKNLKKKKLEKVEQIEKTYWPQIDDCRI